jgi:hypothetical protein
MALAHSPSIVTNGLVLCLDAANPKSYPGTGTTWTDISGSGNNGTLVNGVGYSSDNSGTLVFDGSNDYVSFNDTNLIPTAGLTVSAWAKTSVADRWLLDKANGSGTFSTGWALVGNEASKIVFGISGKTVSSIENITTNLYLNIVGVWIPSTSLILYLNGVQANINNTSIPSSISTTAANLRVGGRANNTDYWNGNISQVSVYNRALTTTEVTQNFNAFRGRFNI